MGAPIHELPFDSWMEDIFDSCATQRHRKFLALQGKVGPWCRQEASGSPKHIFISI